MGYTYLIIGFKHLRAGPMGGVNRVGHWDGINRLEKLNVPRKKRRKIKKYIRYPATTFVAGVEVLLNLMVAKPKELFIIHILGFLRSLIYWSQNPKWPLSTVGNTHIKAYSPFGLVHLPQGSIAS